MEETVPESRLAGVSLPGPHAGIPFSNREKVDERPLAQKPPPTRHRRRRRLKNGQLASIGDSEVEI